eukprot:TRINITY_DN6252_c0_g1_i3.p1 TRINITY_DN6252_c0_g1~~TRINITY_DN6252_c0_g1_i3.p1  ORF type:complete len:269 (+),score=99.15 TRINITY_DN6252_c0_g1_i3:75-809(+)
MAVEPSSFVEGQEIRIQLKTVLDGLVMNSSTYRLEYNKKLFNVSDVGSVRVRMYTWQSSYAADCEKYKGTTPIAERNEFGMTQSARYEGLEFVQAAHVTFPAPSSSTKFIICFKHRLPQYTFSVPTIPDKMNDVWQVFSTSSGQYVFQATASKAWYYLPVSAFWRNIHHVTHPDHHPVIPEHASLLISGRHDKITPVTKAEQLAELLHDDSEHVVIEDASHQSMQEQPEAVCSHIEDYINRILQ